MVGMTTKPPGFFDGTEMPTAGWWEALWPDPAGVLRAAGLRPGMDVIDLCSGDGWFTLQISKFARHVIAIDIDAAMLEIARNRLSEAGVTNCDFIAGDAYKLTQLCPQPVDLVFMANAFHGVPDKPQLSKAVRDVLKPGGRFSIVNWHARPREETPVLGEPRGPRTELRVSPAQTIETVLPSGLELVEVVDVPPYHYGAIFRRPS
jgi:ubiquinone/menaquinone biosynthesis C-methylase UbiE